MLFEQAVLSVQAKHGNLLASRAGKIAAFPLAAYNDSAFFKRCETVKMQEGIMDSRLRGNDSSSRDGGLRDSGLKVLSKQSLSRYWRFFTMGILVFCLSVWLSGLQIAAAYDLKDNAIAHARNGQLLMERGQYEEAIEELKAAILLNPFASMAAPIYNNLGLAYRITRNYPMAYASFQRACRMQPPFSLYYRNLINTYNEAGQLPQAQSQFEALTEDNPENAEAWFLLALSYQKAGNMAQARPCFERFLQLQPEAELAKAAQAALKQR
jgi:tetratricopeptide (TPR) repeat protein